MDLIKPYFIFLSTRNEFKRICFNHCNAKFSRYEKSEVALFFMSRAYQLSSYKMLKRDNKLARNSTNLATYQL